jgi:RHS repeat-associated protein
MLQPARSYSAGGYRYGFNGKENDNEVKGSGNQYDYGFRIYDPRIGRFLSVDPLTKSYPFYTPYQFAGNMPIAAIDLDGAEAKVSIDFGTVTKDRTAIQIAANVDIKIQIINLSAVANKDMNLDAVAYNLKSDLEKKLTGSSTEMMNLPFIFKSEGNIVTSVENAKTPSENKDYSVTYTTKTSATVSVVNDISQIDNNAWVFAIIDDVRDDADREVCGKAYGQGYGKVAIGEAKDFSLLKFTTEGRNTALHEILHLLGAGDTYPPNSGLPGTQNKDNAMYSTQGKMNLTVGQLVQEIWRATIGNVDGPFRTGASAYKQPTSDKDKQPTQEQLKEFIKENGTASKLKED